MTKNEARRRIVRQYMQETGKTEFDTRTVAKWAAGKNLIPPLQPIDPVDQEAKAFARAMREDVRRDKKTKRPYRTFHAVRVPSEDGRGQMTLWFNIDDNPPRKRMHRSLMQRREQIVGDATQLTFDADHWNDANPKEDPIQIPLDFTDDVEWAKHADNDAEGFDDEEVA